MSNFAKMSLLLFLINPLVVLANQAPAPSWNTYGSPQLIELARFENRYNPVDNVEHSDAPFYVDHYDIPLSVVEDLFLNQDHHLRKALIFERDGKQWVRWIPNPDDTQYKSELLSFLERIGAPTAPKQRFLAYRTSSRSLLIFDPETGLEFSAKASTNRTRGHWNDKPEKANVAKLVVQVSNYVSTTLADIPEASKPNIAIAEEPGGFAIRDINQGLLIREYKFEKNRRLLPLFSFFHETMGRKLALTNGYENPEDFLKEKLFPVLIKSQIQLALNTGIMTNSGHGQNFLVEVNENYQLTDKIVHRDIADARINPWSIYNNGGNTEIIKTYAGFRNAAKPEDTSNELMMQNNSFKISVQSLRSLIPASWFKDKSIAGLHTYVKVVQNTAEAEANRLVGTTHENAEAPSGHPRRAAISIRNIILSARGNIFNFFLELGVDLPPSRMSRLGVQYNHDATLTRINSAQSNFEIEKAREQLGTRAKENSALSCQNIFISGSH